MTHIGNDSFILLLDCFSDRREKSDYIQPGSAGLNDHFDEMCCIAK